MILEEEYQEAEVGLHPVSVLGWVSGAFVALFAGLLSGGAMWAVAPLAFTSLLTGFFAWLAARYQRTILAWRDQKRIELAQEEAERLSGPRLRPVKGGRG